MSQTWTPVLDRSPIARRNRLLRLLALVAAVSVTLTSSFDIFLVLQVGGTYRFCQVFAAVLVALALLKRRCGAKIAVLGALPLCSWVCFQIAFVPASGFWPKGVGYCFWLVLNVALVFSFVQLFSDDRLALRRLLRWYAWSFGIVAACGIAQFVLPALGLPGLLIAQWWIPGQWARVNGFSYEPSYFATYLLIGFVLAGALRRGRATILSPSALAIIYWLTLSGILLSSSRMGIIFLVIDLALSGLAPWLTVLKDICRFRLRPGNWRPLIPSMLGMALLTAGITATARALENNPATMLMLLNGTGVSDTAAHSVIQREDAFEDTIAVFLNHPIIGRSLGGVSHSIGEIHGENIHSFEASKNFEGMSVFAEVLAGSGVIGAIPFVAFLVLSFRKPLLLANVASREEATILRALLRSLLFLWGILQFNQNLLRPYLWVHVAVLATVYANILQAVRARRSAPGPL